MKGKAILFISLILSWIFMLSCNDFNQMEEKIKSEYYNKIEEDPELNDYVQDTFFGATFGDSEEVVINKFKEHGFCIKRYLSDTPGIIFKNKSSSYCEFGGINFPIITVLFHNGQFSGISFMDSYYDKGSALSKYKLIKEKLESKYVLIDNPDTNPLVYASMIAIGRNNCNVVVSCMQKSEDDPIISVDLLYLKEGSMSSDIDEF